MSLDAKRCAELLAIRDTPPFYWANNMDDLADQLRDALTLLAEAKEVIKRTNADERSPEQKRLIHKLNEAGL